mmetsp:Transcript_14020/g.30641  ORF Transcript_14020/g.30641 Transcript_14020/m.30641 type:complete len:364 (+) Transcript_14020:38-1129(+)|eukprot:CAMPEP_0168787650 /NCGR_PEP_ID=MMETSP0725-20121227/11916_1 /TAXON_ID=265536 /ORGANISM="Amphiprora sp., Strain CCMP467" /LENGTH=363 /DNA_ID=CAMNT_0008837875 /DNA_START=40 /DNA_END=1131 /DNA_ORIENTATION=-
MNTRADPNEQQMKTILIDLPEGKAIRGGGKNGRGKGGSSSHNNNNHSSSGASVNACYKKEGRDASDDTITTAPSTTLREEEFEDEATLGNATSSSSSNNNKRSAMKSALHHPKQPLQLQPLHEQSSTTATASSQSQQQQNSKQKPQQRPRQSNNNNNNNNSSSKNAKPKQRRVHFPKQQRALSTIAGTSTSDSMPTVWWSPQEMETMHEHAFAVVDFFAKYKVEYTHAIRTMVSQAAQSGANLVCLRTAPALTHVMGGTARGLETCTVEVLQHRRDHVRRQVLRKQHVLRQDGNNNSSNAEERARSLSLQYENLSRYASLWAQILADGDALEAAESPTASRSSATAVVGSSSNNKKSLSKSCH